MLSSSLWPFLMTTGRRSTAQASLHYVHSHSFSQTLAQIQQTFIVPAELFPARLRSTCHGISAAASKAGAIVGAFGFLYAAQDKDLAKRDSPNYPAGIGMKYALIVLSIKNACGFFCTSWSPRPTKDHWKICLVKMRRQRLTRELQMQSRDCLKFRVLTAEFISLVDSLLCCKIMNMLWENRISLLE
jgi:hypothetical protein